MDATSSETESSWPPYNIATTGDGEYRIELAVAGFTPEQLSITAQQNVLVIEGKRAAVQGAEYLHRGIKGDAFVQRFNLADFVKVQGADYAHGVLSINLAREVPEEAKPRQIAIGSGTASRPEMIEHRAA
ncbi:Hsp20 family protein [Muricoccus aerilatus]|uniref:Hsp20 family protein n=1 Tax=Muricoccus aerilatus TaxID=452982 RepID=UPI0006950CDA|nr:Hsp20 family protein [Roseomonas aerilata]